MIIKELKKAYGDTVVLDNIDLELHKSKVTSFIGPIGAGKSTVLNIISRLIAKDEGSVILKNKELMKWKSNELSKHLAILTQSNNIQMKLTIKELVAFGRFPDRKSTRLNSSPIQKSRMQSSA